MAEPYSMIIIGDGWRSRFLCRMAQAVPDKLRVNLVVGHHADRLEAIARDYGVPTTTDADAVATTSADFVAVVVSWPATPHGSRWCAPAWWARRIRWRSLLRTCITQSP